jgi:ankyrin repeat protein
MLNKKPFFGGFFIKRNSHRELKVKTGFFKNLPRVIKFIQRKERRMKKYCILVLSIILLVFCSCSKHAPKYKDIYETINKADLQEVQDLCKRNKKLVNDETKKQDKFDQKDMKLSPLAYATTKDQLDIVKFLVEKGALVNEKQEAVDIIDGKGTKKTYYETPVSLAATVGNKDMVDFLISKGAEINPKDKDVVTPLYNAVTKAKKEIVDMLLSKGADVNAKNVSEITPLGAAAFIGQKEICEALISKGADVNTKNNIGITPLHAAAFKGHLATVELLLSKGADVNAKDNAGFTPLKEALNRGRKGIIKVIKAHGGKV